MSESLNKISKIKLPGSNAIYDISVDWDNIKNRPLGLPDISSTDNGKILMVVNGVWTAVNFSIYDGELTSFESGDSIEY